MSLEQQLVFVCNTCGVRVYQDDQVKMRGWCHTTQPGVSTCPKCLGPFNEDYFLRGKELGISGYENYRWLPDLTVPMCVAIAAHCGITRDHAILDFGCARGYVVRAFRQLGYAAYGYDTSRWALENADEVARPHMLARETQLTRGSADWVVAKDVLEHVPHVEKTIDDLMGIARVGVFAVVPLSSMVSGWYDVPEYEEDVTHIHRRPLSWWVNNFHHPEWAVTGQYRVRGVKDNYSKYLTGNGFIMAKRIK